MKRIKIILALLLLVCFTLPSFAQTREEEYGYIPFVEQGKTWWYLCEQGLKYFDIPQFGDKKWGTFGFIIQGKRMIDGVEWDEIHLISTDDAVCPTPCAFIREENRKVYSIPYIKDGILTEEELKLDSEFYNTVPRPVIEVTNTYEWVCGHDDCNTYHFKPELVYNFSPTPHSIQYQWIPFCSLRGFRNCWLKKIEHLQYGDKSYTMYQYSPPECDDPYFDEPFKIDNVEVVSGVTLINSLTEYYLSTDNDNIYIIEGIGIGLFFCHTYSDIVGGRLGDSFFWLISVVDSTGEEIYGDKEGTIEAWNQSGVERVSMDDEMEIEGSVIKIHLQGKESGLLSIYSIDGTRVCEYPVSGDSEEWISLSELTKGVYIATLEAGGCTITRKFVK